MNRTGSVDQPEGGPGGPAAIAPNLRDLIVEGRFAPGVRITEREVSQLFGCSAGAAREVFHLLEKDGAIVLSARRGASIIDSRNAPPAQVWAVWDLLLPLLFAEVDRKSGLTAPSFGGRAGQASPAHRLRLIEAHLDRLGRLGHNSRVAEILGRLTLHLAIVEPGALDRLEKDLVR